MTIAFSQFIDPVSYPLVRYPGYRDAQRASGAQISFCQNSGRYPHLNQARLNTYVLFVELAILINSAKGRSGLIVPSGVATDDISRHLFEFLLSSNRLINIFDFENREGIFLGVHRSYKFCTLTIAGSMLKEVVADFVFFAHKVEDLTDKERHFKLSIDDLEILNPITGLCPTFRSKRDRDLILKIHQRIKPFVLQKKAKWAWKNSDFLIMFRSESSSHLYRTPEGIGINYSLSSESQNIFTGEISYLPIWESKLMHQFDYCYATYEGVQTTEKLEGKPREILLSEKPYIWSSQPRNWVVETEIKEILDKRKYDYQWLIGYRDVTRATDQRTSIASFLPIGGAGQPLNLFLAESPQLGALWTAAMNSFVVDYIVRQTIGGIHLNITTCRQLPIVSEADLLPGFGELIYNYVLELVYISPALEPFAQNCGYDGAPFRWDNDRRFLLRCELDAAYFHLYGIQRNDVDYIMETFPIVKRKDEQKHGHYRTKDKILEIYDAIAETMKEGRSYQTLLDPPPADPSVAHPSQ